MRVRPLFFLSDREVTPRRKRVDVVCESVISKADRLSLDDVHVSGLLRPFPGSLVLLDRLFSGDGCAAVEL